MSDAIKRPTTIEEIQYRYAHMVEAYRNFETIGGDSFKRYYQTQLNNYRDTCVMGVERLMRTNPSALQEIKLWKY
jgi:hypothetical protein